MKGKFQLFSLTKGEQRVVLLIVIGLLLGAAWRIEQRPRMQGVVPLPGSAATPAPVNEEAQEQD